MSMTSNHLYTEYNTIQSYTLTAPNFFDYLELLNRIVEKRSLFYSVSPDKQMLCVYAQIGNWYYSTILDHLPDSIRIEKGY